MTPGADAAADCGEPVDEFDWIRACLAPLAADTPEALGLLDDAAVVPSRPGFDLILSKDAIVEGVHFLPGDPLDLVARKLLRVNLSDLAAKGAEPYGYMLAVAWPKGAGWPARQGFARGLGQDMAAFGVKLLGGDTVSTPGPLTASVTILGWVPQGRMVRRGGARPGDVVLVSGSIGDGHLGLEAAQGGMAMLSAAHRADLADRYRLPRPRLDLIQALRTWASAAADISDGLIADAGHIAEASGLGLELDLDRTPLSEAAAAWLATQLDPDAARLKLAAGGDDYEVVCTTAEATVAPLIAGAKAAGVSLTPIGRLLEGEGTAVRLGGRLVAAPNAGYRHG